MGLYDPARNLEGFMRMPLRMRQVLRVLEAAEKPLDTRTVADRCGFDTTYLRCKASTCLQRLYEKGMCIRFRHMRRDFMPHLRHHNWSHKLVYLYWLKDEYLTKPRPYREGWDVD